MANEWDVVDEKPVSEWDVISTAPAKPAGPPPSERVGKVMAAIRGIPNDLGGDETLIRKAAEQRVADADAREKREGGIMGAIRHAIGVAENVNHIVASPFTYGAGLLQGGNRIVQAGLAKAFGRDELAKQYAADVVPAFEREQASFAPRTPEGQDIASGETMRQISNTLSALGPNGMAGLNVPHGAVGAALAPVLGVAAKAGEALGAAPRAARNIAAEVAPGVIKSTAEAEAAATKKANLEAPKNQARINAIDNGFKLTAEAGGAGPVARTAESLAGRKQAAREHALHNNENAARLVREDLGLADDVPLTPEATAGIRKEAGEQYQAVKDVGRVDLDSQLSTDLDSVTGAIKQAGEDYPALTQTKIIDAVDQLKANKNPEASSVIEMVKDLRNEADKAFRSGDKKLGHGYKDAAQAMDNALDRALTKVAEKNGTPELADAVGKYREARVRIAKSYLADSAMDGAPGDINMGAYARALKKGAKLDGPALQVAEFAKHFGDQGLAVKAGRASHGGPMPTDLFLAALRHPGGIVGDLVTMGARPAVRAGLGSRLMQQRMAAKAREALPPGEAAPVPAGAPELALAPEGALPSAERPAQQSPLGDLTPDWETAPGAASGAPLELVPTEGLVRAVDETDPTRAGPRVVRNPGSEIPAVPGRPGLPDVMVAGAPAEVASTAATGAAMLEPNTQLAMRNQRTDRNVAAANAERAQPVPKGEATEIKPQVVEPAGSPKVKEPKPEKLPVGEATEIKPETAKPAESPKTDARLAEVERLKAASDSPVVKKALEERAAKIKKELKEEADAAQRRDDATELRRTAALTADPEIKAHLFEKAKAIEKADAVPTGKTAEGQPEIKTEAPGKIPVGKAKDIEPPTTEVLADLDFPKIEEAYLDHQQREHARSAPAPEPVVVERGRRQTRAAIEKGIADGTFGKDEGALALWALDQNPNLARGLRLEVKDNVKGDISRAVYKTAERLVEIFKNRESSPDRAAHEILHHSERMMPPEVQRGIRREWRSALEAEMKKSTPEVRAALKSIEEGISGGPEAFEAMKKAFKDGVLDRDKHYHLTNPSEFFAVNASRILHERFTGRNAWRTQAKTWLKEMVEHMKGTVGLRSDAPVLKALNDVLNPKSNKGVDRSPSTLKTAEGKDTIAAGLAQRMRERKQKLESKA